jgi:hypothetical protein
MNTMFGGLKSGLNIGIDGLEHGLNVVKQGVNVLKNIGDSSD